MFRKDSAELKSHRKWASSHTLDIGILVETKKAFSSTISYPKLKKLPPLSKNVDMSALDLSQNPYSKQDYTYISNIDKKIPVPIIKTKESSKKEALGTKLKSLCDLVHQGTFKYITVSNSNEEYQVPLDILCKSPTIKHIWEATRSKDIFKESLGNIDFSVSDVIMKEVLCFMYSDWIKENLGTSYPYEPVKENILQVLEFGLYLGLQGLVESCCDHVCTYLNDITSLEGLPDPVILKIFSQMELVQLIEWEFKAYNNSNMELIRASYVDHFNQNIAFLLGYVDNAKFDSTSQYQAFCRNACIQWFLDTYILNCPIDHSSFQNLILLYGPKLTNLTLKIDRPQRISLINNNYITSCLKTLKSLSISYLNFDYQLLNLPEMLLTPSTEKLCLSFGDQEFISTVSGKSFSKLLKTLTSKRRNAKTQRSHYSYSKMDVSGVNHFTSDESTVSELMTDICAEADLEVVLNFHFLNDDIIYLFENCNHRFTSENISCLSFANLNIGCEGVMNLIKQLPNFKNLKSLNISGTFATDEGISYLMKNLPPLKMLDLSKNITNSGSLESLEAAKLIAKYIMRSDSCLKDLNLSGNRFSFAGIRNILEALDKSSDNLSIDISDMEIKTCLAYISKNSHSTFTTVNLAKNAIIPRSLNDFVLIPALIGIEYLDLSGNYFDQSVLDSLANQISGLKLSKLSVLKLAGYMDAPKLDSMAFQNLLLAFLSNSCKNIKELDLSGHLIGDQSCVLLARICLENKKFQVLNLANNRITIDGLVCFSSLGNKKSRIFKINLCQNYIHGSLQIYTSSKRWRHYFQFDNQLKE